MKFVQYFDVFVQTVCYISISMDSNLKAAMEELLNGEVLWK